MAQGLGEISTSNIQAPEKSQTSNSKLQGRRKSETPIRAFTLGPQGADRGEFRKGARTALATYFRQNLRFARIGLSALLVVVFLNPDYSCVWVKQNGLSALALAVN